MYILYKHIYLYKYMYIFTHLYIHIFSHTLTYTHKHPAKYTPPIHCPTPLPQHPVPWLYLDHSAPIRAFVRWS